MTLITLMTLVYPHLLGEVYPSMQGGSRGWSVNRKSAHEPDRVQFVRSRHARWSRT